MERMTTTKQISNALSNNLLQVIKVEVYHKTSRETETIPNDKFLEYFDFFCESGIFVDAVGWHFERNHKTGNYEIETGRMNRDSDVIVTAYLRVNDSATDEEIQNALLFEESED